MKRRRESNDPDATEKQLDRVLFDYRSHQHLLKTLPLSRLQQQQQPFATTGGKPNFKPLAIPSTILEHAPPQPDSNSLLPCSSANSPRNTYLVHLCNFSLSLSYLLF